MKTLIVEDVEMMLHLLEQVIAGIPGFEVTGTARNVTEARVLLRRERPELVLLDEVLPGESSLDFLSELAQSGVPAILLTSMTEPEHRVASEALGRLLKPEWENIDADRQRIAAEIRSLLGKTSSR